MRIVTIYGLKDPRNGNIRYVGKTKNRLCKRLWDHCKEIGETRKCRWVESLRRENFKPEMIVLDQVSEAEWERSEMFWIEYCRRSGFDLTNATSGGDGCHNPTQETREKMAVITRLRFSMPGAKDCLRTPERRAKISAALTGIKRTAEHIAKLPQNKPGGRKLTTEQRQKISAGSHHRIPAEWEIEALRKRNTGRTPSDDTKRRIRKNLLLYQSKIKDARRAERELQIKLLKPGQVISFFCPNGDSVAAFRSEITSTGERFHHGEWRMYARSSNNSPRNVCCLLITREDALADSMYSIESKNPLAISLRRPFRIKIEEYMLSISTPGLLGPRKLTSIPISVKTA